MQVRSASEIDLLLIPGFMADASLWDDVAEDLKEVGPVWHADLRQGRSIAEMADGVIARAPPSFAIIGFSMGGYVARDIARRFPDRVRALVLVATSARADTPEQAQRKAVAAKQVDAAQFAGLSRKTIVESLHPDRADNEVLIERVRRMSVNLGGEVFVRQATQVRDGDLDRLGDIGCPTLIVVSAEDRLRSLPEARELKDGIPRAEMRMIEGAGHMIPMETPAAFLDVVVPWLVSVRNRQLPDGQTSE